MASLSTSELKKSISAILKGADLNSLSSKKIRKKLEEQYDTDFNDRKAEIDKIVMAMITAEENEMKSDGEDGESDEEKKSDQESDRGSSPQSSESEEEKKPPPKKSKPVAKRQPKKNTKNDVIKNKSLSEESSDDDVEDKEPPKKSKPAPKKQSKKEAKNDVHIKSDSLSEKSEDDADLDDEALARKLQEEERSSRSRAVKRNAPKKETSKKSNKSDKPKAKRESLYSRKCLLSADLADVVGESEMARHDVVKKMWTIVRERDLLDPKNKQFMCCDEQLSKVFGKKRVRMFGMMKYLKNHIKDQS